MALEMQHQEEHDGPPFPTGFGSRPSNSGGLHGFLPAAYHTWPVHGGDVRHALRINPSDISPLTYRQLARRPLSELGDFEHGKSAQGG